MQQQYRLEQRIDSPPSAANRKDPSGNKWTWYLV